MGKMKVSGEGANLCENLRQQEIDLLENMKELMLDAELVEEFEDSVWLKVDAELWRMVMSEIK